MRCLSIRVAGPTGVLALALSLLLAVTGCAASPDATHKRPQHTLRLALNQTEDHPSYTALEDFGKRLKRDTDGRWTIDVYPNSTLGDQEDVVQLVSSGAVDLAIVSGTQLENLNKDFRVFNLPEVFDSIDHQMRVINNPAITSDLYHSLDGHHLRVVGGLTQGARSLYTVDGPVRKPADLKGMKVRVQASPAQLDIIRRMGGSPTPMSFGEVYTALQSGVIDGAENNEVSYLTQKHYETAGHFAKTDHEIGVDYLVGGTKVLHSMSATDRKVFNQDFQKTANTHTRLWKKETRKAIAETKRHGATYNDVDKGAFADALHPLIKQYVNDAQMTKIYRQTRKKADD